MGNVDLKSGAGVPDCHSRNSITQAGCRYATLHISGPNDDEFDALPEGGVLRQPDGLGIAAPEGASFGDSHGVVTS